jgi:hypothetical protein
MHKLALATVSLLVIGAWPAAAQPDLQVSKADLSIPFGSVSGKLAVVGDYLIFIDEDRIDSSFALQRNNIEDFRVEGDTLHVQAAKPVNIQSHSISNLTFRLQGTDPSLLSSWYSASRAPTASVVPSPATVGAPQPSQDASANMPSYAVRHKKWLRGDSHGRLIVTSDGLRYESINDVNDSRSWPFKDIKELKYDGTYQVEIIPFNGDNYNFEVQGSGMTREQFNSLVNKVTQARASG